MKRLLIVGSTSIVGRALAQDMASRFSISTAGRRDADVALDLAHPEITLDPSLKYDVVVHAAADFGRNGSSGLINTAMVNAIGTLNVCRLAQAADAAHLVVLSSIFATHQPGDPYYGAYGVSKRHGEELAGLSCAGSEMTLTILRPTQIYDAQSANRMHQPLFYTLIDKAEKGDDITLNGRNDARRNFLFLDDLCRIVEKVIERRPAGTFACPGHATATLSEIAGHAYAVFGNGGQVAFDTGKPDIPDVPDSQSDPLYDLIGYSPTTSLAEGIARIKAARSRA